MKPANLATENLMDVGITGLEKALIVYGFAVMGRWRREEYDW